MSGNTKKRAYLSPNCFCLWLLCTFYVGLFSVSILAFSFLSMTLLVALSDFVAVSSMDEPDCKKKGTCKY